MKIENDKYYTPIAVANKCWDKVIELIGKDNIADVIEPSCGNGAFYHYPSMKPNMGIDIAPEIANDKGIIITADYLNFPIYVKICKAKIWIYFYLCLWLEIILFVISVQT